MSRSMAVVPASVASRVLEVISGVSRFIVGPAILREKKTILIPVRDEAFAPVINCGEFAVVDTTDRWPVHEGLFFVRYAYNYDQNLSIVCLMDYRKRKDKGTKVRATRDHPGPFWEVLFGRQQLLRASDLTPNGEWIIYSDGYQDQDKLEKQIVGRIVGVLGCEGRPMNWSHAAVAS